MTKWECIHKISEQGKCCGLDGVLKLLEWCGKLNTSLVTQVEAEAFLALFCEKGRDICSLPPRR